MAKRKRRRAHIVHVCALGAISKSGEAVKVVHVTLILINCHDLWSVQTRDADTLRTIDVCGKTGAGIRLLVFILSRKALLRLVCATVSAIKVSRRSTPPDPTLYYSLSKVIGAGKGLVAVGTLVRLFLGMCANVALQVLKTLECATAARNIASVHLGRIRAGLWKSVAANSSDRA